MDEQSTEVWSFGRRRGRGVVSDPRWDAVIRVSWTHFDSEMRLEGYRSYNATMVNEFVHFPLFKVHIGNT